MKVGKVRTRTDDIDRLAEMPSKEPNPEIFFQMQEEMAIIERVAHKIMSKDEIDVYARRHGLYGEGVERMQIIADEKGINLDEAFALYDSAATKIAQHFKARPSPRLQKPLEKKKSA